MNSTTKMNPVVKTVAWLIAAMLIGTVIVVAGLVAAGSAHAATHPSSSYAQQRGGSGHGEHRQHRA